MKLENTRMSATRIINANNAATARYAQEKKKGSTAERYAYSMKKVEYVIRHECYEGGLRSEEDFRARRQGSPDIILTINGVRGRGEVKCGGTVSKGGWCGENFDECDIMPDAVYVIIPLITEIYDDDDVYDNSIILTRAEYLDICRAASRKGIKSTFHITGPKTRPVIAYQSTPLAKVRATVKSMLESGDCYTVRDYVNDHC